jgi:RsiW-degrading membrane proteinase PrsW (M82 family)
MTLILTIYVAAAVLPALFLMGYIYKHDRIEKEPFSLLTKLVISGVYSAFLAIVLERIGTALLDNAGFTDRTQYIIWTAVMVGVAEEVAKFIFLYIRSWNTPHFNYRYDGIVYAVFVSLGFAAFENIKYVFYYGIGVAPSRALLAVPAHMAFGVFMGSFYGWAKIHDVYGQEGKAKFLLLLGILCAAAFHAFYDACAMLGTDEAMIAFIVFVVIMYFVVIRKVKRESQTDMEI